MISGVVIRLILDRGFGFIKREGGCEYLFVRNMVEGDVPFERLRVGQAVTFSEGSGTRGPRCLKVVAS